MKKNVLAYLLLVFFIPVIGMAQVDSTAIDSLSIQTMPDTLDVSAPDTVKTTRLDTLKVDSTTSDSLPVQPRPDTLAASALDTVITTRPDTLQSDSVIVIFKIKPWAYHAPVNADTAATDSTLRWQVWPSWTYKKNRDPGVISYRLGTIGRTNALQIDAHEPKYQELYWENIRLNNPVSGIVNWNYIPHHKIEDIYEENVGTVYKTKFYLRDYYLNKPLTQLNYTESNFNTRDLQFVVSDNFSQKTNAEISYWDRRDGGEYNNSGVVGRQIYARITHQIDGQQAVKMRLLNNNYDNGLPFGYDTFGDPASFAFDPYSASAVEPSGEVKRNSTIFALDYYRRPADSTKKTSDFQAGIFSNTAKRRVTYSADTTAYKVRQLGATIQKWLPIGPLKTEGMASYTYNLNNSTSLDIGNWGLFSAAANARVNLVPFLKLNGQANYRSRSDAYSDYRLGIGADFSISSNLKLAAGIASGTRMPTPQQLYWRSNQFAGNTALNRETIQDMYAKLHIVPFSGSKLGVKTELKQIDGGIGINADSTFKNANPYSSFSNTAFFNYRSEHFEFNGSATMQQFGNFLKSRTMPLPVDQTQMIWFKSSAYVKGYLFDRATYVKAGLSGMMSPQPYSTAQYYPSLDFWQSSQDNFIPSFNRLDVDLSARIRSIMVLLRYENVLDDVVQQGYFETAGYPMVGRRLIFGIRVIFRN